MRNMSENLLRSDWKEFCHGIPRESTFRKTGSLDGVILKITLPENCEYCEWQGYSDEIAGGLPYKFNVEYKARQVECESKSIYAVLSWYDHQGSLIERNYADRQYILPDGWRCLEAIIEAPQNAVVVKIQLALRWAPGGTVRWRAPYLAKMQPVKHRMVNVATTYMECTGNPEENLVKMREVASSAGTQGADIICLTETPYSHTVRMPLVDISQPVPGKLTDAMSEVARQYGSYLIFTMIENDGGKIYNTAVLIDRKGNIAGKYRKSHLPLAESEAGVLPGETWGVFDTDFGRIGIMICWDQAFPEVARALAILGAEVIFIPTIGDEPLQQAARAKDNGVYVVVSGMYGPASSRIIDPKGDIVGTVADGENGAYMAKIDLDRRHYTYWLGLGPCNCEAHSTYLKDRRTDLYGILSR